TPNDVATLKTGRAHYTSFLTPKGTFVDDLLIYRMGADRFMVVANAGNAAKDFAWLLEGRERLARELPGEARCVDVSDDMALIALQGPRARSMIADAWT